MATGYTSCIEEDASFEQFVWNCAKAFVPECRDNGQLRLTPESVKNQSTVDYHTRRLKAAHKSLNDFYNLTERQIKVRTNKWNNYSKTSYEESLADKKALLKKYQEMLAKVDQWQPPSEKHSNLKEFMKSQIEDSIKHDCNFSYMTPPVMQTTKQWQEQQLSHLNWEIDYHRKELEKYKKSNNDGSLWIKQLEDSIGKYQECP